MNDFVIFLITAPVLVFALIGAAVICMALVIVIAEFGRDLKEDLRKRKEIKKYEEYKTSEEKSEN